MQTDIKMTPDVSSEVFDLYPNPVPMGQRQLTLRVQSGTSGPGTLVLRNTLGQTVLRRELELTGRGENINLQIPSLPPGYYQLSLHRDGSINEKGIVIR
jgi:hypothetical protein